MEVQHPARFGWEMIRAEEESKRREEGGSRKEAKALIALLSISIIYCMRFILCSFLRGSLVYWEVYLSAGLSLTPAGMCMYVRSRLNFI